MKTLNKQKKITKLIPNLSIPNQNFSTTQFYYSFHKFQPTTIPSIKFSLPNSSNRVPLFFQKFFSQKFKFPIYNALISWYTLYTPFSSSVCHPPSDGSMQTRPSLPPSPLTFCFGREDTRNQQQNLTGLKFRLERKWISRETGGCQWWAKYMEMTKFFRASRSASIWKADT